MRIFDCTAFLLSPRAVLSEALRDAGQPGRYLIRGECRRNATGDEICACFDEARGFAGGFDVERNDGDLENLGPPFDEIETMALSQLAVRGAQAESDIIGPAFAERHGAMAGVPGVDTYDRVRAQVGPHGRVGRLDVVTPG